MRNSETLNVTGGRGFLAEGLEARELELLTAIVRKTARRAKRASRRASEREWRRVFELAERGGREEVSR